MTDLLLSDYEFAAIANESGEAFGAVLQFVEADDKSTQYLGSIWEKLSLALKNHHKATGNEANCPSWTNWKPREWSQQNVPSRQKFVAWYEGVVAGFVNIQPGFASQHQEGTQVMYLEHMAAFPGFQSTALWNRRLSHVGIPLFAFAVFQSEKQGFSGAIGLHVDGPAIKFYKNLEQVLGFPVFHPIKYDVTAPPPQLERAKPQVYLETIPDVGRKILEAHHV